MIVKWEGEAGLGEVGKGLVIGLEKGWFVGSKDMGEL